MVKIIFTYKNTLLTKSNDKSRNYRLIYFLGLIDKENISKLAVSGTFSATNFVYSLLSNLLFYVHNFCNF